MKKLILPFLAILVLGCSTRKSIVLYQDIDSKELIPLDSIASHPKIQVNDILSITTTALNPESVIPFSFNTGNGNNSQLMQVQLLKLFGYLVNTDGQINFPQLGMVNVAGKTTQELQSILEEKLSRYIKNPTVSVRISNFKFTIQGEIARPGTYEILDENLTLPQAIGMGGDLTINGTRENIMIVRQKEGQREVRRIDLTQTDWMNTEYYFVKPNDIIYIEPNSPKIKRAGFISGIGNIISVISILLSIYLIAR